MAVPRPIAPSFFSATTEGQLVRVALELGAAEVGGPLSLAEERLVREAGEYPAVTADSLSEFRLAIEAGEDPLGALLCNLRPSATRRKVGAFYTPPELVRPMVRWILSNHPDRIVDAGCGSGRFAVEVARRASDVLVLAIDVDPLATILTRAALAVLGQGNAMVLQDEYLTMRMPGHQGRTGFLGNPPYVRHHDLAPAVKAWARRAAWRKGYNISSLAGLHALFYLATALHAEPGDVGCFVTSSEWLDVGYGAIVRNLLLGDLGGQSLHVLQPTAAAFADAMTTAAVSCFEVGAQPLGVRMSSVPSLHELGDLGEGGEVPRDALAKSARWSQLLGSRDRERTSDLIPLGEIARVHRGVVTGSNEFFVLTAARALELGLERWCRPAITKAQEILTADGVVRAGPDRRMLLDVPGDVDRSAYPELDAYLRLGEEPRNGRPPICSGYICRHRRPWWRLGTPPPPPVVVSYMARQAPAFALNPDALVPINIAHGLYPESALDGARLRALVETLNRTRRSFQGSGRTYHGGMEKFEPRELEALLIPAEGLWA